MKKIIAFMGPAGSGKDTAANFLKEILQKDGRRFATFAFANHIKEIVHRTFGISEEEAEFLKRSNIRAFNGKTLREIYQELGENIKKILGQDIWVKKTLEQIDNVINNIETIDTIIVTDLRFEIEDTELKKYADMHGIFYVPIIMQNLNIEEVSNDAHVSEKQYKNIEPQEIISAKSVEEIKTQLEEICTRILSK